MRARGLLPAILLVSFLLSPAAGRKLFIDFEKYGKGSFPADFISTFTGSGRPGIWKVVEDETAPSPTKVLAQLSMRNFGYHFNLAVVKGYEFSDLRLTVYFKAVRGREDRGGGPVWRYRDADNYYIARANPLEDNFRVYKVVNGIRKMLASVRLKITSGQWHRIDIENIGDEIKCYYDGKLYLHVRDSTFRSGKVGLWTKADAVTYFDNLTVEEVEGKR